MLGNTAAIGAAKSGAVAAEKPEIDADLARMVEAWPTLSAPIRTAMLALLHRAVNLSSIAPAASGNAPSGETH
jgi:hypothetical protein